MRDISMIMPTRLAVLSAFVLCAGAVPARAAVIAAWTFENVTIPTTTGSTGPSVAPSTMIIGDTGNAFGVHANSATNWGPATGNGSATGYSSDHWSVGDYFEFDFSPLNLANMALSFDTVGSASAPGNFQVETTTNGSSWSDLANGTYTVNVNSPPWTSGSVTAGDSYSFTLPNGTIGVRLVDDSTTSVGGGTAGNAGSIRVDNVVITGDLPEPASIGMLSVGLLGVGWSRRRRARV
jgi:hypothetical protein